MKLFDEITSKIKKIVNSGSNSININAPIGSDNQIVTGLSAEDVEQYMGTRLEQFKQEMGAAFSRHEDSIKTLIANQLEAALFDFSDKLFAVTQEEDIEDKILENFKSLRSNSDGQFKRLFSELKKLENDDEALRECIEKENRELSKQVKRCEDKLKKLEAKIDDIKTGVETTSKTVARLPDEHRAILDAVARLPDKIQAMIENSANKVASNDKGHHDEAILKEFHRLNDKIREMRDVAERSNKKSDSVANSNHDEAILKEFHRLNDKIREMRDVVERSNKKSDSVDNANRAHVALDEVRRLSDELRTMRGIVEQFSDKAVLTGECRDEGVSIDRYPLIKDYMDRLIDRFGYVATHSCTSFDELVGIAERRNSIIKSYEKAHIESEIKGEERELIDILHDIGYASPYDATQAAEKNLASFLERLVKKINRVYREAQ